MKRIIAHINHTSFEKSQTFIYNYISNLKRFHPICLTWKIVNIDQFPFPKEDMYPISFKKYSLKWIWVGGLRRYSTRDRYSEKIIKRRNAALIHAHFGPLGVYAQKMRGSLGIPLITTFYGYDLSNLRIIKKRKNQFKTLFKKGDLFLVEGSYMKTRLMELGCPQEKIQVQRIGIPLNKIVFRPRRPKRRGENVILIFSGRFEEKKGLLYALKAVKEVREKYNNFEFRIIGDGSLRPRIEEFIRSSHMNNYVHMQGFLSYDNYIKEMQKADIFIHPSVTASNGDSEGGAPTTILEAQAAGLPVVSTYHADIPNIVIPGKSALLSHEKDYKEISKNIKYLFENQDIWEHMGIIGRDFVETYHNVEKEVNKLEEKYDLLL